MTKSDEYLNQIKKEFKKNYKTSKKIRYLLDLSKKNGTGYPDAYEYSEEVSNCLREAFKVIDFDNFDISLIDEKIIDKILLETLGDNYKLISDFTEKVQLNLNRKSGIGLNVVVPKIKKPRINGLIQKFKSYENIKDAKWILEEPITNFSMAIVDNLLKENVKFHYKSGLTPTIKRVNKGGCCEWCSNLAGVYEYPKEVPRSVFKRHRFCKCQITYDPKENGEVQDIWSKSWKTTRS